MLRSARIEIWGGVVLAVAGIGSVAAATTQTRTESAAEVKETAKVFSEYRRKQAMAGEGESQAGLAEVARFQSAFSRAVALYEKQPDDAAALTALSYVLAYCQEPVAADRARCTQTLRRAQQAVLEHWTQDSGVSGIALSTSDMGFLDALYDRNQTNPQLRMRIAEIAGSKWSAKFHDPKTPAAERKRAYDRVLKYGNAMMADRNVEDFAGRRIPIVSWKGEGLVTSVQKMAVGQVMPEFSFITLERKPVSLASQRGKVLLLDFWATWCVPCVKGMPALKEFRASLAGQPFEIVAINTGDTIEKVVEFQKKKISMPWINWHQDTASRDYFRLSLEGLPSYLVLDKDGTILARGRHFDAAMKEKIRAALPAAG